jgi:hypothetical protein
MHYDLMDDDIPGPGMFARRCICGQFVQIINGISQSHDGSPHSCDRLPHDPDNCSFCWAAIAD